LVSLERKNQTAFFMEVKMSRGSIVFRVVGILVLIAVLAVAGSFVYRAGYTQGVAQSPAVATAISGQPGQVIPAPYPPMYGYYPGPWHHPFFGFFPFGCFFGFFLIFLFFGALRMIFFPRWYGRRHWHHHGHGPWGGPSWERGEGSEKQEQGKGPSGPTQDA
jgi:hypothetical protein